MRGTEWAPLYMLVVLAIAAVLLVTFVKPMFRQAAVSADTNTQAAKDAAKSLIPLLGFLPIGGNRKNGKNNLGGTFFATIATAFANWDLGPAPHPQPLRLSGGEK